MGKYTLDDPRFELKPCPFCGGKAIYIEDCHENSDTTQKHSVGCPTCEVSFSSYISYWSRDYKDEMAALVEKWNKRATCKPENSPSDERTTDKGMFIPSAPNEAETGDFSAKEALAEIGKAFVKFGEAIDKAVK